MEQYNQILTLEDGIEFLKSQFDKNASIQVTDGFRSAENEASSFSFIISAKGLHDGALYAGDALFGNFHSMVAVRPYGSDETEYFEFKKPYAMFMMEKIRERIAAGDDSITIDDYADDFNIWVKQEYDKQIEEVEKEYFDNIIYFKDRETPSQKGE